MCILGDEVTKDFGISRVFILMIWEESEGHLIQRKVKRGFYSTIGVTDKIVV